MEIKKGIGVSSGIAIGPAFLIDSPEFAISRQKVPRASISKQIQRFDRAREAAAEELQSLIHEVESQVGSEGVSILQMHAALLQDPDFHRDVERWIRDGPHSAEYAVARATRGILKRFESSTSFIAQRGSDIRDMEHRLLRALMGTQRQELAELEGPVVIVARDLTPTLTATLDRQKVKGIATELGGKTSHTAIIARALRIPAVVGLTGITMEVSGGDHIIVDGVGGKVLINPTSAVQKGYREREKHILEFERQVEFEQKDLPAQTLDGHNIVLRANIELVDEVETASMYGAQGIGLYRTEFLYGDHRALPDEQTQVAAYREVIQKMGGQSVTIRTLDLGADKFNPEPTRVESNPFLGCRSIRYCFERIDLFKTQLRAILQAAVHGKDRIMFPMISALEEVQHARLILDDVQEDLLRTNLPVGRDVKVGIMIEVPSAALIADILAEEVDFFSIGTNDLVQYTLAVDRTNERVATLYQPAHPANFRLLGQVIEAGERHGVEVAMCGEMASDYEYVIPLIGLGLRELSMVPTMIPELKRLIRSVTMRRCEEVRDRVMAFQNAAETDAYLREVARRFAPEMVSDTPGWKKKA